MQLNSKIQYIVGSEEVLSHMPNQKFLPIFSNQSIDFFSALSKYLLKDKTAQQYPDVVTLAFWCRKASIEALYKDYKNIGLCLGRGIVFHIAPSNVAVNFAYSFVTALLAGNASIVRLPSKNFPQVGIICEAINKTLAEIPLMAGYIIMVRYDHDQSINDRFSAISNVRVIWGGDNTIHEIRKSPLQPRATEITFADRNSFAVIDADAYLASNKKDNVANGFYNDTYLTDQNACTSPRIIIWLGQEIEKAKQKFWSSLHDIVQDKYILQPIQAVDKLTQLYILGAAKPVKWIRNADNIISRIDIMKLDADLMHYKANSGFFMEYKAEQIEEILPLCDIRCQTLSYYGVSKKTIEDFIQESRPKGVDRIVPIGRTMDFSLIWDGNDLIRMMSRVVISV
jgi:hypothetical protein